MVALTFLTLGLAAIVSAAPAKTFSMPPHSTGAPTLGAANLPLGDITWTGQLHHGGPNVSFTGRHHDVADKIRASNPHWLANNATLDFSHLLNASHPNSSSLEKRSNRVSQACWQNIFMKGPLGHNQADSTAISTGLYWMSSHFGGGTCSVGPKTCGRFSCSYDSATLMCNDNPFSISIPCATMIQNMAFVFNLCSLPSEHEVEGQAFYINPSYNVLIKRTDPGKSC